MTTHFKGVPKIGMYNAGELATIAATRPVIARPSPM
jgi:hypothetical protein